jgi:hypothetical protein
MSVLPLDAVIQANSAETEIMTVTMVRGDTRPVLEFSVKDTNGVAINLTGASPRLRIRRKGATAVLVNRVCTLTDPTNGKCQFAWVTGDWTTGVLDQPGYYEGELEVTFGDSTIGSVFEIVAIYVREQVG